MKRKLFTLALSSLLVLPLASCKNDQEENNWNFTQEDYENVTKLENEVTKEEDKFVFTVKNKNDQITSNINKENIIVFNLDEISAVGENRFYTYESYKNSEVQVETFQKAEDNSFTVKFDGNNDNHYAVIVNKNSIKDSVYAMTRMNQSMNERTIFSEQDEGQWVRNYIENYSYSTIQGFINVGQYIMTILYGNATANPVAVVGGVFGLFSTFSSAIANNDPTIKDVLNKLDEMDKKLDGINETIAKNQEILVREEIYEQAQIDKVLINQYQQNFTDFVTNYAEPLENKEDLYTLYISEKLKEMVKKDTPQTLSLHYNIDGSGNYTLKSLAEADYNEANSIKTIQIPGYSHAKAFLRENNDVVRKGFTEAVKEDINEAVKTAIDQGILEINSKRKQENYKNEIYSAILEEFEKERHTGNSTSDEYKDAVDLLQKAKAYVRHISTEATGESILYSLIERIKCIYNFGYEAKPVIRGLIANIKLTMERYVGTAAEACMFAKIDQEELFNEYQKAIEVIKAYETANENTPDSFSYITKSTLSTDFCKSIYTVEYKNPGNDCYFKKEFKAYRVGNFPKWGGNEYLDDINLGNYTYVDTTNHKKIQSRLNILKSMGSDSSSDYIKYLAKTKVVSEEVIETQKNLKDAGWVSDDTYRILTSYEGIKELTGNEQCTFTCVACGNPDGYYFSIGQTCKYKGARKASCWSGEKAKGSFIDGFTGASQSNDLISAYARYLQDDWWFIDDEHWAFQNNQYGDYYFVVYQK